MHAGNVFGYMTYIQRPKSFTDFFVLQLQIFNLVSLIIERLGEKVLPCVEKIMSFLPQVRELDVLSMLFIIQEFGFSMLPWRFD